MEQITPFDSALREAHARLQSAHTAAVSTLEGELQRMRQENTLLRMRLAELHVDPHQGAGASLGGTTKLASPSSPGPLLPSAGGGSASSGAVAFPAGSAVSRVVVHTDSGVCATSVNAAVGLEQQMVSSPLAAAASKVQVSSPPAAAVSTAQDSSTPIPVASESPVTVEPVSSESKAEDTATSQAASTHKMTATAAPEPTAAAHHPTDAQLRSGAAVRISGLRGAPELNGQEGVCAHEDIASNRWIIRLASGVEKALRPENLELLLAAASSPVVADAPTAQVSSTPAAAASTAQVSSTPALAASQSPIAAKPASSESKAEVTVTSQAATAHTMSATTASQMASDMATHHATHGQLLPGIAVRISGLRGAPELNGQEGVCAYEDLAASRWIIRLASGVEKALRPENLEVLPGATSSGASASSPAAARQTTAPSSTPKSAGSSARGGICGGGGSSVSNEGKQTATAAAAEESRRRAEESRRRAAEDQRIEQALVAVLTRLGMEALDRRSLGDGRWLICGMSVLLRCSQRSTTGQSEDRLLVSADDGSTWEVFEQVYFRHTGRQEASTAHLGGFASAPPHYGAAHEEAGPQARPPPVPPRTASADCYRNSADLPRDGMKGPSQQQPQSGRHWQAGAGAVGATEALPTRRPDGLPAFNQAFPTTFDARSGSSEYYSSFRVRVPTSSQYEA